MCVYLRSFLLSIQIVAALALSTLGAAAETVTLIHQGALWRYLDNGTDQGTTWKEPPFDDVTWRSGLAQLGYGDGDEETVVSYGSDANNKFVTTYFRHTFTVADPSLITSLALQMLRDDGAVVYLNGTQIASYSMPPSWNYRTYATTAAEYSWEAAVSVPVYLLVPGANVLAVEIHQCNASSSDLSMDLVLSAEQLLPGDAPNTPTLIAPANAAGGVGLPPTLQVEVSDPNSDSMTVTFYGRKSTTAEPFTLVALPDTQKYVATASYAPIFTQQTQWIVDNRAALSIVAVTHEGDIADVYNSTTQWELANTSMSVLDQAGMPYGVAPGNHDQPTTLYNQYFPPGRFSANAWYGSNYPQGKNDNNYLLFSAGGVDFILLQLEFWPKSDVITWADGVLKAHADRKAIITTHGFLGVDATRNVHVMGSTEYIWTDLVVPNPNVWFVLCGHVSGAARRTDIVNGHPVHQLLADYQAESNGGNGWLRILEFVPAENAVNVSTYSPYLNQFKTDSNNQFALEFPMGGFEVVGTQTGVPSGTVASLSWTDATINTDFEWFAAATDPTGRTTPSQVWTFSTAVADTTAPVISDVAVSAIRDVSVLVSWTTDEKSSSMVQFRILGSAEWAQVTDPLPVTAHALTLPGLQHTGTYEFYVVSADAAGNTSSSGLQTFKTKAPNAAPIAGDQNITVPEDGSTQVVLTANDADGESLTFRVTTPPAHGTLTGTPPEVLYTPNANYNGQDSFQFVANDGMVDSAPATVHLEVSAVADAPVAMDDAATAIQGVKVSIPVLGNDYDVDGDVLSIVSVSAPTSGTAGIDGTQITYQPNAGFTGTDSFSYTISDGGLGATATVTVTVTPNVLFNDGFESGSFATGGWVVSGPAAVDAAAAYQGTWGALLKKTSSITKVLPSVGPGPIELNYSRSTSGLEAGKEGLVEVSADGQNWTTVETVPGVAPWQSQSTPIELAGPDLHLRFSLTGTDGNDVFRIDDVLAVGGTPNGAPLALPDSHTVTEDTMLQVDAASGLLANDTDPDGSALVVVLVAGPSNGTLTLAADGSFTYVPAADFNGTDSFTYQASDGRKQSAPATVSITVSPNQDAPVAFAQALQVAENAALQLTLTGSDADGDVLSFSVGTGPNHGVLSGTVPNLTYTPAADYTGPDSFTFSVWDGTSASQQATISITVTPAQTQKQMHISSITAVSQDAGKGQKRGYAEVIVVSADGTPVQGATVSGAFSGDIAEAGTAITGADGKASFQTTTTVSGRSPRLSFEVTDIVLEGWTYDPSANVESWDKNY